jgi:hypothetical protein
MKAITLNARFPLIMNPLSCFVPKVCVRCRHH